MPSAQKQMPQISDPRHLLLSFWFASLPKDLGTHLNDACSTSARNLAEVSCAASGVGQSQKRVIQRAVGVGAPLELQIIVDLHFFGDGEIEVRIARPYQVVTAFIAECIDGRIGIARRIEPLGCSMRAIVAVAAFLRTVSDAAACV